MPSVTQLCEKIDAMLYTTMEKFLAACADASAEDLREMDYRLICRRLRVAPADLDEILEEELGVTGEELLRLPATFVKFADYHLMNTTN